MDSSSWPPPVKRLEALEVQRHRCTYSSPGTVSLEPRVPCRAARSSDAAISQDLTFVHARQDESEMYEGIRDSSLLFVVSRAPTANTRNEQRSMLQTVARGSHDRAFDSTTCFEIP